MQHKTSYGLRLLLLALAIAVSHMACAGTNSGTFNDVATPSPEQYRPGLASAADNLARLTSYRADYDIDFTGSRAGQQVAGQIALQTDVDRAHQAVRYAQNIQPYNQAVQALELVRLPNVAYLNQGAASLWFRAPEGQAIEPADLGVLVGLEDLLVLPQTVSTPPVFETWRGRNVQKYMFSGQDLSAPGIDFAEAQGEMRVDVAGNYVMQYALTATIAAQSVVPASHLFDSGQLTVAYNLSQPDAVTVALPAGAPPISNTLTALPRPPDAEVTAIYPALLEYTSAITPISATLYFGSHLPPLGWTPTITGVFQEKARLAFNRNNEAVTILIAPGSLPAQSKVTLSLDTRP